MRDNKIHWRINEEIRARELRVIGPDGKQIDVLSREKALEKAKEMELDLIEIAPNANPPVAKITNFGKFRYAEEKKARQEKKKSKAAELKEIRFSPFIGEADYQTRIARIKEFLDDSSKVKIVIVFKGRQMGSSRFGYELLKKILKHFGENVVVDMEPKFLGRHLVMIISPLKKKSTVVKKIEIDEDKLEKEFKEKVIEAQIPEPIEEVKD